jgi:hypothetical protein
MVIHEGELMSLHSVLKVKVLSGKKYKIVRVLIFREIGMFNLIIKVLFCLAFKTIGTGSFVAS